MHWQNAHGDNPVSTEWLNAENFLGECYGMRTKWWNDMFTLPDGDAFEWSANS